MHDHYVLLISFVKNWEKQANILSVCNNQKLNRSSLNGAGRIMDLYMQLYGS